MLKLILSLILLLSCMFIGQSMSAKLYRRKETLSLFYRNFQSAGVRLRYASDTVYDLFEDFAFEKSEPFLPQWEKLLLDYQKVLQKQDVSLLREFAYDLGNADTESEIRRLELYISILEERIGQAQTDIEKKARLYRVLGFTLGVTLAILIV